MSACPTEAELLDAIEGRLSDADRRYVNAHLEACDTCRELIERLAKGPTPGADPMLGMMLGEYLVEERIGQGGMGVVYRARQPLIGKQVAVKLLRGSFSKDPEAVQRLLGEAQAVNAIGHRGIIDIFSFGQLPDGRRYVMMEYLVGTPLSDYLRATGKLTPYQALVLLDELLAALAAAHGAGILHRDLKPSNLFLVAQPDGTKFIKVLDFGLSRPMAAREGHTRQVLLGTPAYMSPELIRGEELGAWTDLYAVGVIAWQMLAGRRPFEDTSIVALLKKQLEAPVPPLSQYAKDVPAPVEAWVMSLLAKDWRKRPHSTAAVRADVRRMLHALSTEKTVQADDVLPPPGSDTEPIPVGRLPHPSAALPPNRLTTDPELPAITPPVGPIPSEEPDGDAEPHTTPDVQPQDGGVLRAVTRLISRFGRKRGS